MLELKIKFLTWFCLLVLTQRVSYNFKTKFFSPITEKPKELFTKIRIFLSWQPCLCILAERFCLIRNPKDFLIKQKNPENRSFLDFFFYRGWGARTPIDGFGDRCSTIELIPYIKFLVHSLSMHLQNYIHDTSCFSLLCAINRFLLSGHSD